MERSRLRTTLWVMASLAVIVLVGLPVVQQERLATRLGELDRTLQQHLARHDSEDARRRAEAKAEAELQGRVYFPDPAIAVEHAESLREMKEPSLWTLSQSDRAVTAYRLLWIPSDHQFCVRVTQRGDVTLHAVQLDATGGYDVGKIALQKDVKLSQGEWNELERHLALAKFWTTPTFDKEEKLGFGADVDLVDWVLEGVRNGQYHVVVRQSLEPGEYDSLCTFLIDRAGLDVDIRP